MSIDPRAAPALVIGGLPRSRLPLLGALLALTVGFVVAGILQLRRERALAALRADFVSRVSHELRTPLTQIRMFAETLLLGRVRSEEERHRSLEILDREARRLGHLVENILQFSRGERGAIRLHPRSLDPAGVIREVAEEFQPLALRATVRVDLDPARPLSVVADEDSLRQILLNLLDNAVKYGPEGQEIRVGAASDGTVCRLWVEDDGPGIPPAERERIWGAFERLPRDRQTPVAGTGIGLSVVRELVTLQGGRCWAEASPSGGARLVLELPSSPRASAIGAAGSLAPAAPPPPPGREGGAA